MLKVKKENLCLNAYNNISELYNFLKKTPRREDANNSSEDDDNSFRGTQTLEEAYDLMLTGDEKLYKDFKSLKDIEIDRLLGNTISRKTYKDDVVGFQPNVPKYLLGIPVNMINEIPTKLSQKVVNIVLCMSVSAFTDSSTIKRIGMKYTQIIDVLEKSGYRCNLYICHAGEYLNEKNICLVKIKTDKEPFNLKKCVFPIAHPAMFRRIMFKWMETCDVDKELTNSCYGHVIDNKKVLKTIIGDTLKTNIILWNFQNNEPTVKDIIENLKKDGIKIGGE